MTSVKSILGIKESNNQKFSSVRQSIEQTEDYAIKKVVTTQELVVRKLFLDKVSNTYFMYNTVSSQLDLYVNGVLIASW
jgi:hypothetical protein